jgi:hypothetical protein
VREREHKGGKGERERKKRVETEKENVWKMREGGRTTFSLTTLSIMAINTVVLSVS